MFDAELAARRISQWMKNQVEAAGAQGIVLGLSGGVDSAVVAYLGKMAFGDGVLGVIMPCHSMNQDEEDARLVATAGKIATVRVELDAIYEQFCLALGVSPASSAENSMALANLKPRLRMTTLYYHAQARNYLVAGTGNLSEKTMGYFTKHGDSGVDIFPIGDLVKSEVRQLAAVLGVPPAVIDKAPSAGLWEGQTDEGEMGITYQALDRYIRTGEGDAAVVAQVERAKGISAHKLNFPPYCPL